MTNGNAGSVFERPLAKRLFFSALIIAGAVVLNFFAPLYAYFLGVETILFLCLMEFFSLLEKKGLSVHKTLGILFGLLMPLNVLAPVEPILFLTAILILFLIGFDKHSPTASHSLVMTSNTLFGVLYIAWFGSFMLKMRLIPETGAWWIFYVVFTVKMGDAGAYFVGKNFGRTKLLPHISPNKSVEGALACSVVVLVSSMLAKVYLPGVSLLHLFFLGLALGVLAQIGDLVESLIKRNLSAKDSGFIPGLGGMLDIMDSLLFSFPFVYFYVQAVPGMLPQ